MVSCVCSMSEWRYKHDTSCKMYEVSRSVASSKWPGPRSLRSTRASSGRVTESDHQEQARVLVNNYHHLTSKDKGPAICWPLFNLKNFAVRVFEVTETNLLFAFW